MSGGRIAKPKSLYIEAVGVHDDGSELVIKMRLEPATTDDSFVTLDMESLTVEGVGDGLYVTREHTGEHNIKVEFTRCRLVDP